MEELQNTQEKMKQLDPQDNKKEPKKVTLKFKNKKLQVDIKTICAYKMSQSDNIPQQVFKNLYIGSIGAALYDQKPADYGDKIQSYKSIKIQDKFDVDIVEKFQESNQFIREAVEQDKNILVHCFQGKSRSVTLLIAYLIYYEKMTRDQALELIRKVRPHASPNYGFMKQLLVYEKEILKGDYQQQKLDKENVL